VDEVGAMARGEEIAKGYGPPMAAYKAQRMGGAQ